MTPDEETMTASTELTMRAYESPRLVSYGPLKSTASGVTQMPEGTGKGNAHKQPMG